MCDVEAAKIRPEGQPPALHRSRKRARAPLVRNRGVLAVAAKAIMLTNLKHRCR